MEQLQTPGLMVSFFVSGSTPTPAHVTTQKCYEICKKISKNE